mgnify:CR=1 FL=1
MPAEELGALGSTQGLMRAGAMVQGFPKGDILLLETPFFSQTGSEEVRAYVQSKYNLALLALGSYLRSHSEMSVFLINMVKDRISEDSLIQRLRVSPPKVVGIPLYSYNLGLSYQIISRLKAEFPSLHVCVGGPHVGMFPDETIQLPHVDSIVLGDGEEPFLQISRQVLKRGCIDEENLPPGTTTKASHAAGHKALRWQAPDLDALPMPDLRLLGDHSRYRDFLSNRRMAILTTSRGCPFACHYCSSESSKYRSFSIGRIIDIMKYYQEHGVEYVEFWDETFNPNKRRLEEFADALTASKLRMPWGIRGAVVLHTPVETLRKLHRTGLRIMQFGVETAQPRLADYLNKRIDPQVIRDAFASCRAAGIRTVANLMVNIPGETKHEMLADLQFLEEIKATYVSVSVYNWAPGTTHYTDALKRGMLQRDHWREFATNPVGEEPIVHATTEVPIDEVYSTRDRFICRHYFNPSFVARYLRMVEPREALRAASIGRIMLTGQVREASRKLACRVFGRRTKISGRTLTPPLMGGMPEDSQLVSTTALAG